VIPPALRKLRKAAKEDPQTEPHIVPLSTQAIAILRELQPLIGHREHVFPGVRDPKRCMSNNTVNGALRNLGYTGAVHANDRIGIGCQGIAPLLPVLAVLPLLFLERQKFLRRVPEGVLDRFWGRWRERGVCRSGNQVCLGCKTVAHRPEHLVNGIARLTQAHLGIPPQPHIIGTLPVDRHPADARFGITVTCLE